MKRINPKKLLSKLKHRPIKTGMIMCDVQTNGRYNLAIDKVRRDIKKMVENE